MHLIRPLLLIVALSLLVPASAGAGDLSSMPSLEPSKSLEPDFIIPWEPEDVTTLTVATYNVNYGLAGDEATLNAVWQTQADVVVLQETTASWETEIRGLLSEVYPHMAFEHGPGAGGLAVLSKTPIEADPVIQNDHGWFPGWRVLVETSEGPLQLLALHLKPQISDEGSVLSGMLEAPAIHRAEIEQFAADLDPDLPTLVLGDLNEGRLGDAVTWLESEGFANALPTFAPDATTWRWELDFVTLRRMFDHILVRGVVIGDAYVLDVGRSDHLPVVAKLEL